MTFFGKQRNNSLFDQQAYKRSVEQNKEKRKRRTAVIFLLIIIFISVVILLNVAIRLPRIYSSITKPFENLQSSFYLEEKVDFNKRTNLLLLTTENKILKEVALASIESGRKKIVVLQLSPETLVFGQKQPRRLSDLISFRENKPENIDQLATAVLEILGYSSDGYILLSNTPNWINNETLNKVVGNSVFSPGLGLNLGKYKTYLDEHLYTNLTINEIYTLSSQAKKITPERFDSVDTRDFLSETGFIDQQAFLNEISVKLNDNQVAEGNYSVEIVNASGVDGLGTVAKTFASNLGANVVQVSSTVESEKESQILANDKGNYLAKRFENLLKIKTEETDIQSVDVKIILGEDFGKFFNY